MDTLPHRWLAVTTVLAAAHTWTVSLAQVGVMGVVAVVTGGGALSPDVDNQAWFKRLDRLMPDEWLGAGGPLQHRGITHWWVWPALLAAYITWGPPLPTLAAWGLWGVVAGWGSHLLGDFLFGAAYPQVGRAAGIPLAPWWWHVGLGLPCGGWTARIVGAALTPATAVWLTTTLALHLPADPRWLWT